MLTVFLKKVEKKPPVGGFDGCRKKLTVDEPIDSMLAPMGKYAYNE